MPSSKAVGAAPLITGLMLAFESARAMVQSGLSPWSIFGVVGGSAAVIVGLGILRQWETFDRESEGSDRSSAALFGLAAVACFVGVAIYVA